MYVSIVLTTMVVLPVIFGCVDLFVFDKVNPVYIVLGQWFVFWAFGVRLFVAGIRQSIQPQFTAEKIFEITDKKSFVVVQELGFANISMGTLGIISISNVGWILPSAVVGFLYYGLAAALHLTKRKNKTETIAMVSDIYISVILIAVVVSIVVFNTK